MVEAVARAVARMLREEFPAGAYELCVHPGYFDPTTTPALFTAARGVRRLRW